MWIVPWDPFIIIKKLLKKKFMSPVNSTWDPLMWHRVGFDPDYFASVCVCVCPFFFFFFFFLAVV